MGVEEKKLVMTLLVRNEEDIVRYNIDFHLRKGVDFIIATDNGSTDSTRNILKEYEEKGVLHLIDEAEHNHNQAEWNNCMARMARDQYGADIIFHCDADEFWVPRSGNLKDEILKRSEDILIVNVVNMLLSDRDGEESFPEDTRFAVATPIVAKDYMEETKHTNLFYFLYPPKVIFKTRKKLLWVSQGNHAVVNKDETITEGDSQDILIYHYPVRSKARFYNKVIQTGSAYENNNNIPKDNGFHARRWYESYKKGLLDQAYTKLLIDDERAVNLLRKGFLEECAFRNMILDDAPDLNNWKYYHRKFEYEEILQDFYRPWAGHKKFAYDLVRNIRPHVIVELGNHRCTSFFSFCQGVKDAHYDANLYAVDTWQGDRHAEFYEDNISKGITDIIDKYYGNLEVNLLRENFDDALEKFDNDSIDLLHIDGYHTYDAVRHDFEAWLPKIKSEGIILLHDIFVSRDDFGVYKLWEELKRGFKTIEFYHSYGLGVILNSGARFQTFVDHEKEWQIYYCYMAEDKKNESIKSSLNDLRSSLNDLQSSLAERDKQLAALLSSRSWHITYPIRATTSFLRRLLNSI